MEFYVVRKPESEIDELYHHGIKGMHWGIRRFQLRDGTWTNRGLKRREKLEIKDDIKRQKNQAKEDKKEEREFKKTQKHEEKKQAALASGKASKIAKYRSELSDEEVEKAISRINMQTRMDQAIEAQKKVGTDKLNRITNTVKTTANNVVDIYDTAAAVANATGLLEKELPVIFKDQKRHGVTISDRGLEQRVARGTATDEERRRYDSDRSARERMGTLNDRERTQYREELERRERRGSASQTDTENLNSIRESERERQRSILTPSRADFSRERADSLNRQAEVIGNNSDRFLRYARAASDIYGANDPRTQELNRAASAYNSARAIAETRAGNYNAGDPNVRSGFTKKYNKAVDKAIKNDAAYKRAKTSEERARRDAELRRRTQEVDDAYSALRNLDPDALMNKYADLADAASKIDVVQTQGSARVSVTERGMSYRAARDAARELERQRKESRGMSHSDIYTNELYHHGIKGMHWGIRRFQRKNGTWTTKGKKHREQIEDDDETKARRKETAKKAAIGVGVAAAVTATAIVAYKVAGKSAANKCRNQYASDFAKEHRETMEMAQRTAQQCKNRLNSQPIPRPSSQAYKPVTRTAPVRNVPKANNVNFSEALRRSQEANRKMDTALQNMNRTNRRWR